MLFRSVEKSKWDNFTFADGKDAGGFVYPKQLKKGLKVTDERGTEFVVTDVLSDGDFRAIPTKFLSEYKVVKAEFSDKYKVKADSKTFDSFEEATAHAEDIRTRSSRSFTLADEHKTTTQQGIKITPEIRALIRGDSPLIKQPSHRALEAEK